MSKFFTVALIAAFLSLNLSSVQAKSRDCTTVSKAQYTALKKLKVGVTKQSVINILGNSSCKIDGYIKGMAAYGYNLNYDRKNWLVVIYKNGKAQDAKIVPYGMGLRAG
ncbi:hypothetical protein [Phormidesmis sp. 146-33]